MNVRFPRSTSATLCLLTVLILMRISNNAMGQTSPASSLSVTAEDYSRLTKPEIAAAMKLSDEQKTSVQQIITERDTASAAAEETARPAIGAASNEKLKSVLTADQQRLFASLFAGKTLRFNFRSQKWGEVLDWISKEADLSLVMETPPPGVFTYSDSKDYTTTESIDLLNGWLLTKGFTLVRRERMLMCLDLKGGLPEGAIPRVTPEELATRGRYEFISVLLPLAGRPAEAVMLEVKPLLGSYGKAEPLAQTQQLLVFDTAANLRVIEQIVQKVPIPQTLAVESPKPVLTVYPIEHANPAQAGEVLKTIVAGTVVVDAKARQISVNAIPAEQDKARTIIGQLESNQGPDTQPRLQLYSVQVSDADQMLATLKLIAPDGTYRIDPISGKLVAWASEKDQARISESLQMIQAEQPQGGGRQLQVYALKNADPTSVSTILVTVVPTARITINAATRSLIAFGTLTDHEAIRALIEQLEAQTETAGTERVLRTYPASTTISTTVVTLMTTAVPRAQVLSDIANQRLLVMATADEHAQIDLLLMSLAIAETAGKQLEIHEADRIDTISVTALLATLTPQATVTLDAVNKRLLVVASEQDQLTVAEVLEQVQTREVDSLRSLKSYPLQPKIMSTTIIPLLTALVPKASATPDEVNRRLLITATEKEHTLIDQVIEQVQMEAVGVQPQLQFYPLKKVSGTTSLVVLQSIAPLAKITFQPDGNRYSIIATVDDHAAIAATLDQLEASAAEIQRDLKFYDVASIGATDARTLLAATYADVTFVATAEGNKLMAWVSPDQDARIRATLEQLTMERPFEATRTMELYSITDLGPTASTVLAQAVPKATITPGARADQLAIVATSADHVKLKQVLEQLQMAKSVPGQKDLTVHQIAGITPASVLQVLQPLVDADVQLTVDPAGQQLFVRAFPEKQQQIKAVVEQVTASLAEKGTRTTKTYVIGAPNADEAQEVLLALFPDATLVTDVSQEILVATATILQHETITKVVEQMASAASDENAAQAKTYPLRAADGENAVEVLNALFRRSDNVRLSFDEKTRSLIAVARPEQHIIIQGLVDQLEPGGAAAGSHTLAIYALPGVDGLTAVEVAKGVLQSIDPSATVSWEKTSKQLIVTKTEAGQQEVKSAVEQFQDNDPREMDVIQLRMLSASSAQNAIEGLYGDSFAKDGDYPVIQADEDSQQLLVRGSKKQLQDIRMLLAKMGEPGLTASGVSEEPANRNLRVIPIQGDIEPTLLKIQDLWPRVRRNPIRILRPDSQTQPAAPELKEDGQFSVPAESLSPDDTDDEPAPIVIIPGLGRITIASDDIAALDQLESILHAVSSSPVGTPGNRNRDFSVYQLRNAGAEEVAETLEAVYESRAGTLAFGSVVIVPEPRMNALIVYGGRTDRDRIEQLLEILDTEKLPDSGRIFRTQVIPVKHADAEKVETVLKGVYRTELSAGGSRRSIEIPAGIDSSVANVLRQINAAASAPLLTIEVQVETNSLVVKAPQNLIEELSELVTQLDESSATNRAQGVTLIPLKQTNTRRVMRILDDVLD